MAEFERIMAAMGAVPAGARPKQVIEDGGEPGYYSTDPLSQLTRIIKANQLQIQDKLQKQQEASKKQADMYKTLREAGYDPKSAYEAVINNKLTPPGAEADTSLGDNKKNQREKILDKIAKGQTLTTGEQQVYDDTIKRKPAASSGEDLLDDAINGSDKTETPNQKNMREKILAKLGKGEALTPGEQKIYDEVIKKGSGASGEDALSDLLPGQGEMVKVIDPAGIPGSIPKSKLSAALKRGYKTR